VASWDDLEVCFEAEGELILSINGIVMMCFLLKLVTVYIRGVYDYCTK
jgi:hypothetical protein